jgi:hypothetical protein
MTDTDALVERLRKYATAGRIGGIDIYTIGEMFTQSADTIAAQAARIEALEKADQWLPIESAPKDGTRIIVFRPTAKLGCVVSEDYWVEGMACWWRSFTKEQPTHWRPLPAPPEAK